MAEPHSSSAGLLWLLKTYGIKAIGFAAAGALLLAAYPPKTFREGMFRFSSAILCSMLFGDAAVAAAMHYLPWLIGPDSSMIRIGIYALAGGPVYLVLGFAARVLEAGGKNPFKALEILRGKK